MINPMKDEYRHYIIYIMKELVRRLGELINSYQGNSIADGLYYLLTKIVYKV